jgi:hypothetical protein
VGFRIYSPLFFAPIDDFVKAWIVPLTNDLIHQMDTRWWSAEGLRHEADNPPIDRDWRWADAEIDYEDKVLASANVGIVTGDNSVQGAMLISMEAVHSRLDPGAPALFVERLFTAPSNRENLREDGQPQYVGVGTQLLAWGAWLSRDKGCGGRLKLDASPGSLRWYARKGLQRLNSEPIVFEGTSFTPMELPMESATKLIEQVGLAAQ